MSRPTGAGEPVDGGPRVLCVAGESGSGKTALLRRLLPRLNLSPAEIGVVKHTHHAIDWHPAGKDSDLLWEAGPGALCVSGPGQAALFVRTDRGGRGDPAAEGTTRRLVDACRRMPPEIRLVLAEGFREAGAPKIWTAAGGPEPDRLAPGVRAAVVPEAEAEAWREAHPGVEVRSRAEATSLAARIPVWAVPLPELTAG